MKRFTLICIFLLVLVIIGAKAPKADAALIASDCTLCHTTTVSDFKVPLMTRSNQCSTCHGRAWHAKWTDPVTGVSNYATYVNGVGYFKTADSVYAAANVLHDAHYGNNAYSGRSDCNSCHGVATCSSCHTNVNHTQHSTTAFTPPSFEQANGTISTLTSTSCALSQCHQQMPSIKRTNTDGSQICINCHPRFGATAKDSAGHDSVALETAHDTVLPGVLNFSTGLQTVDCSGCHVSNLATEHSNRNQTCTACHNNQTYPAVLPIVKNANGIPANRACEKCHFNIGVIPVPGEHRLFHIATQANGLKVDGAPHANCNTCHQRTTPVIMQVASGTTSLAQLAGSTTKDYSCLSCHNGAPNPKAPIHQASYNGQAQNLTDFHPGCNTCHDPNVAYAKDSTRKPSNDVNNIIATKNGVYSCTDCHINLAAGHQSKFSATGPLMTTTDYHLDCATCHKSSDPFVTAKITTLKGTSGYDCQTCHNIARTAATPPYSPLHSAQGDEITGYHPAKSCNSCHGVVNGAYKVSLSAIKPKTLTTGYGCTDCHGTQLGIPMGKHAGLTSVTATVPVDVSAKYHPTCATCHKDARLTGPTGPITTLKASGASSYQCTECHNTSIGLAPKHQAQLTVDANVAGTVYEITQFHINTAGAISCDKCHDNNTVLPTAKIGTLKAQAGYKCADCHNAALAPDHKAALAASGTPEPTVGYHNDCLTCHNNSAVKTNISTGTFRTSYLCTTCHNSTIAPQPNHMAKADANAASENISTTYHATCNKCHGNPNYPEVNNIIKQTAANKETDYLCSKCHNATLNLEPKHKAKMAVSDTVYSKITDYHIDSITGKTACGMCHGTTKLPANTIATLKASPSYLCNDCHTSTSQIKYSHTANYGTEALNQITTDYHPDCQTCHDNVKAKPVIKGLIGQSGYDCDRCHDGTTTYKALHQAKLSATVSDAVYTVGYHKDCLTCHASTNTNVINFIDTKKNPSAPYLCNDCHTNYESKHVGPALATGMVDCSWCHTNNLIDTHINPTIQLPKKMDCATCHDNVAVRSQIDGGMRACADCHNGIALEKSHLGPQVIPKHTAVFPTFMPEYSPKCVNCHYGSTPGTVPYIDVLHSNNYLVGCSDCHLNTAFKPAVTSLSTDCTGCHNKTVNPAMDMTVAHDNFHTVNVAVYQDSAQCLSCHKADTVVASAYTTYSSVNNLLAVHQKKPSYTKVANCDACHGTAARTEVKQAIAANNTNCTACHLSADHKHQVASYEAAPDVNCVKCHSTGTDPADATVKTTELSAVHSKYGKTCATCHISPFQGNVIAGDGSIDMMKGGSTAIYCSTCHNGDVANGYAATRETKHAPEHKAVIGEDVNCSSCHDGTTVKSTITAVVYNGENAFTGIHAGTYAGAKATGCNTCHDNANFDSVISPKVGKANTGANAYNCAECHDGVNAGTHNKQHTVKGYLNGSTDTACASCHSNGDVVAVHSGTTNAGKVLNCNTCHSVTPALSNTTTVIKANLSSNASRTGYTCQDCHSNVTQGHKHPVNILNYSDVTPVSCRQCHSTELDGSAELVTVHDQANSRGQIPNYSCATCHNANIEGTGKVILKDGVIDMRQNGTTLIYCGTCHNGTYADALVTKYPAHSGTHSSNPSAYGAYINTYGGITHDDSKVDCSKCHTDLRLRVIHNSTAHPNVNCNSCHTSQNTDVLKVIENNWSRTANKVPYTCADCHNTLPYLHKPEHQAAGTENVTCNSCHDGITVKGNFNVTNGTSADVTGIHQTNGSANCNMCHSSANTVVSQFIANGKGIVNQVYNCESCHDSITPKHNKQHTVASYLATGNSTSCANCHNADVSVLHSSVTKATLNCDTCHGANPALPNTKPTIVANLSSKTATPNFTCQSCHSNAGAHDHPVAANGYEQSPNVDCASCHATEQATGKSELVKVHQDGLGTAFSCETCHNTKFEGTVIVSDGTIDMLKNADPSKQINCSSCHDGSLAPARDTGHLADHKAQHSATNMDCTSCHGFTLAAGTPGDITSTAIHKNGCNTCHGSATRNDVKLVIASKKGQTNPVYTCEECHGGTIHIGWESKHQPVFPANEPAGDCAKCHNNYLPTEHEKALTAASNAAIGYKVFRSPDGVNNWTEIGSTTATSFANTGLAANTTYYYKVQAYDGKPNYSGFSNTVSVKTLASTPVVATVNPDSARYVNGSNNGDSSADPSSTSDVLASLTDTSNSSYSDVRENGSQDRYIFVNLNKEAGDYTKVELKMNVRYNNSGNLIIYPYQSNGTSINTSSTYYVKGASRSSSSNYITETIDVTKAAQAMKGYGWMKFRIKPDPSGSGDSFYIAKVELVLSQSPVSGGTATNPPGTLTPNSNDTAAPSAPSGLTGTTNYYDRVDLTWTASTDTGGVTGNTCAVCHSATTRQQAKDAVAAKNANCSACHTLHADIATAHTGPALPTTPSNCSGCHSNVLSVEHSNNAKLAHNATLNCDTCHSSALAKVKAAINSTVTDKSNLACTTCHTGTADGASAPHNDLAAPHLTGIFPFAAADADCLKCHTTQATEFVATKASYHTVSGLTAKTSGIGKYVSPYTATSIVGCKGCHGSSTAGGTTAYAKILKQPYTYLSTSADANMLCYLCHDRNTYGGSNDYRTYTNTGFRIDDSNFMNLHNISDHKDNNGRLQCSWCHSNKPHSTDKAHLVVTKTDPNSAGNVLTSFTHPASGQYQKSSCVSDVSLCYEHRRY